MTALCSRSLSVLLLIALISGCGKAPNQAKAKKPKPLRNNYEFGQVISFGRGGGSDRFKRAGWSETEKFMTWTNGRSASLTFTLPESTRPLKLRMNLVGFTYLPTLPYQTVEVVANNEVVGEWQVSERADFVVIISPEIANHVELYIELRIPQANSPKALNIGDDNRTLGVSCFDMAITETDDNAAGLDAEEAEKNQVEAMGNSYAFGTVVSLGAGTAGRRYKVSGWYTAEKDHTWAGREPAVLEMKVPPSPRSLRLKMKLGGMVTPGTLPFQETDVRVNGQKIAQWNVGIPAEFNATIPREIAQKGGTLRIELVANQAVSPKEVGIGGDMRVLGVRCEAFVITEENAAEPEPTPSRKTRSKVP